jgi:integrase
MAAPYLKDGKWYLRFKDEAGRWRGRVSAARTKARGQAAASGTGAPRRAGPPGRRGGAPGGRRRHARGAPPVVARHLLEADGRHETNRTTIRKHFLGSELAPLPLVAVTAGRIEAFLQDKTTELAPQTLNHLRSYLSRAFNAARRAGRWPGPNPTQDVKKRKVPRRQPDYLRPHEVPLLLLRALDPRRRPIFAAALYTGLRKGELLALRKADVDLAPQLLTVARSHGRDTTKGGHADVIPIATELCRSCAWRWRRPPLTSSSRRRTAGRCART